MRREALIVEGGTDFDQFQTSWDNKWDGTAAIHDDHWSLEIAIPFSTLRFNEGSQKWRFQCYRFDTQSNEQMTWVRIPRNQSLINLAFMGDLHWEEPLRKTGANIAVIPYASTAWARDYENGAAADFKNNFGGDAKVGITPGLNLDLTFNPDFSQVEVDRQITNLTRFEVFFPERRQFFTENSDLFGGFGDERINPFFSRRIGIVADTASGSNIENAILYGVRLSGKLNDDWRVGLLNMTTDADRMNGLPNFNYTVAAVQRKVFSRSNVGMILVNKQALNPHETDLYDRYDRVIGLDYTLASADNRWNGKTFLHKNIAIGNPDDAITHGLALSFRERKYQVSWSHAYVGEHYDPQVGFVPRKDFFRIDPAFGFFFYPQRGALNDFEVGVETNFIFTNGFGRSDHDIEIEFSGQFKNSTRIRAGLTHRYTYLFEEFDPTRTDSEPLPADSEYNDISFRASYSSDQRKAFGYRLNTNIGEFFDGFRASIGGNLSYRFQPFGTVAINYNIDYIDLKEPYAEETLFLIGPRIDLTFSKSLFFSAIIQYNDQTDNMNINARLQWRFKPVSDLFIVYTDNYLTDGFVVRNRSLVAKATYWLNL